MLITYRTSDGCNLCIAWGEVWSEAFTKKVSDKKVTNTTFFLRYDTVKVEGRNQVQTILISAWGRQSIHAQMLRKHDDIIVFGKIGRENYMSTKQKKDVFKLTAEAIIPMNALWKFLKESMEVDEHPTTGKYTNFSPDGMPEMNSFDDLL